MSTADDSKSLPERQREMKAQAIAVNSGREPKFGDIMHNPWAGEGNPRRNGFFVRSNRVTGRFNHGLWYELTNGKGDFWKINGDCAMFVDHLATTIGYSSAPKASREGA